MTKQAKGPERGIPRWRRLGSGVLLVIAVYLIVRGVAEFLIVDPAHPEQYANAWGGPT